MALPRVVLDTNVLLSALLFHQGSVVWLRHAWQSGIVRPLASRETTGELIRVLAYPKFRLTDADREELLGDYLPWCEIVDVPDKAEIPDCRDPFDRPFLALAACAGADALVTGDKDLLALFDSFKVPILSPAAFRERIDAGTENKTGGDT
ncbi:MAG: putative toxin-antitoxin system toxin component, PIN family [Rhodospirillales bacterium]